MAHQNKFIKNNPSDRVWWLDNAGERCGEFVFSFDRSKTFNLFADYPWKLTKEQKAIFDAENPYWANFFSDRQ